MRAAVSADSAEAASPGQPGREAGEGAGTTKGAAVGGWRTVGSAALGLTPAATACRTFARSPELEAPHNFMSLAPPISFAAGPTTGAARKVAWNRLVSSSRWRDLKPTSSARGPALRSFGCVIVPVPRDGAVDIGSSPRPSRRPRARPARR